MTVITVTPCRSSPEGTNSPQAAVEAGSGRARQRERAQGQLRQSRQQEGPRHHSAVAELGSMCQACFGDGR